MTSPDARSTAVYQRGAVRASNERLHELLLLGRRWGVLLHARERSSLLWMTFTGLFSLPGLNNRKKSTPPPKDVEFRQKHVDKAETEVVLSNKRQDEEGTDL